MTHANNNHRHLAAAILRDIKNEAALWNVEDSDYMHEPEDRVKLTAGRGMPGETRTHRAELGHVDFVGSWAEAGFTFAEAVEMPEAEILAKLEELIGEAIEADIDAERDAAAMG